MQVLPCMHGCMSDYSTDNRGDVGSWVREASMEGLTTCLTLMAQQHTLQPEQSSQQLAGKQHGRKVACLIACHACSNGDQKLAATPLPCRDLMVMRALAAPCLQSWCRLSQLRC